jgi:hypothetical protein
MFVSTPSHNTTLPNNSMERSIKKIRSQVGIFMPESEVCQTFPSLISLHLLRWSWGLI